METSEAEKLKGESNYCQECVLYPCMCSHYKRQADYPSPSETLDTVLLELMMAGQISVNDARRIINSKAERPTTDMPISPEKIASFVEQFNQQVKHKP